MISSYLLPSSWAFVHFFPNSSPLVHLSLSSDFQSLDWVAAGRQPPRPHMWLDRSHRASTDYFWLLSLLSFLDWELQCDAVHQEWAIQSISGINPFCNYHPLNQPGCHAVSEINHTHTFSSLNQLHVYAPHYVHYEHHVHIMHIMYIYLCKAILLVGLWYTKMWIKIFLNMQL